MGVDGKDVFNDLVGRFGKLVGKTDNDYTIDLLRENGSTHQRIFSRTGAIKIGLVNSLTQETLHFGGVDTAPPYLRRQLVEDNKKRNQERNEEAGNILNTGNQA